MLFPRVYDSLAEVFVALKMYVDDQVALLRAKTIIQLASLLSFIVSSIFFIIGGAFFFLFLTVAFGAWMGSLWGSVGLGFLSSAGLWLIIMIVFYFLRKHLFINPLLRRMHRFSSEASARMGVHEDGAEAQSTTASYRSLEALEAYKTKLERNLKREERIMIEGLQGLRADASNDLMEQVLSLVVRITTLRLFPRLRRHKKRT